MIAELEKKLGYTFRRIELLEHALIHRSYNDGKSKDLPDNERLEFLGDSVINLIVTHYLYKAFIHVREGELSKLKAHLVSTSFLFDIARSISLPDHLKLGKGEEKNQLRSNKRIIASVFEAVVGAIYLDSDFQTVYQKIFPFFKNFLDNIIEKNLKVNDYKSELQEIIQKNNEPVPEYQIIDEEGELNQKIFSVRVSAGEKELGWGKGRNKREAEQNAAYDALLKLMDNKKFKKLSEVFFIKDD